MKGVMASLGSAFAVVASLTLLPVVLSVLGGIVLTAVAAGVAFWRASRRRAGVTPPNVPSTA